MARLSDVIEEFIKSLLRESEGQLELQRNELADYFECAPSQINYVLATRFSLNQGYHIESRRGGGGYIRILRLDVDKNDYLHYLLSEGIGAKVSEQAALQIINRMKEQEYITQKTAYLMKSAVLDKAIGMPSSLKDNIRAGILKSMITAILAWDSRNA
ncbi:MAG: CtsR family transcriptional regulator [Caldicoprobacterales bacterium]|nr:CtsR family transcriptional regulator [Clostridiales bacterium]